MSDNSFQVEAVEAAPVSGDTTPPDALAQLGRNLNIVRGPRESDLSYGVRLARAKSDWQTAGTPLSILRQVQGFYSIADGTEVQYPKVRFVSDSGDWWTLDPDGTYTHEQLANWIWDDYTGTRWARFWVIIYPTSTTPNLYSTTTPKWGDGIKWGEFAYGLTSTQVGSSAADEVEGVRKVIAQWKPAHATCLWIIYAFDDTTFDPASPEPDGSWGTWAILDAGVWVPVRLASARYAIGYAGAQIP